MGRDRRRVVHVTTTDISLVLLLGAQLRELVDMGYEVIGVSADGPYVAQLRRWGVRHVPIRHATRARVSHRDALAFAELLGVLRRLSPDLVHTHNPKPGVYGRIAARAARVPVVVNTVHGLYAVPEDPRAKRWPVYALERLAAACSDAELVQNPEDVVVLARLGIDPRKTVLLGNGIDLARFRPGAAPADEVLSRREALGAGPDDVVVGVVGRLVWEKGYREVFDAAASLRRTHPGVRVVVAGPDEPERTDGVREQDKRRAEADAGVHFAGEVADIENFYAACDLVVLASHREGFPRSVMEAAASAVPVVASDIRGCRQTVDHGVTGLLFAARDARALADAVARLADDPRRRRRMGEAARAKAEAEFDERKVVRLVTDLYDRLLTGRDGRRANRRRRPATDGAPASGVMRP